MPSDDERAKPSGGERRWRSLTRTWRDGAPPPFEAQWAAYRDCFPAGDGAGGPPLAWRPDPESVRASNLGRLMASRGLTRYGDLHAWSTADREGFLEVVLAELGIAFERPPERILDLSGGAEDPRWLPGARLNVVESLFAADPDRPAIVSGGEAEEGVRRVSYGALRRTVERAACGLVARGLGAGASVALYMPMTVECVAAYLAVILAGGRVISIADSFPPAEVAKRLEIGAADAVVTVPSFTRGGKRIELLDKARAAGAPRVIVVPAAGEAPALGRCDLGWQSLLDAAGPAPRAVADPYATTNVLFSSGTTGAPKAIPWNHLTPIKCAMDGRFHHDIRPGDVVAWPTNIGWMMGPWLIYAALANRATIALFDGAPTGGAFGRFVRDAGVTMLGVVPSLVRAWRAGGELDRLEWPSVRVFSSTGEPSNREDYLWLMSRAGYRAPVVEYLGGTEIGGGHLTGTVVQPASPATFTTPALGIDVHLLDASGRPVDDGELGELYLEPPALGLSQRLLNRDHHEVYYAGCPRGPQGQVLRRHGDEFMRLPGGFYRARGRADDTMNLGGIKVSSVELEQVLDAHPAVYESAAVAVQLEGEGAERLVVFAVPAADPVDRETLHGELQRAISGRLNPLFRIHDVVLSERLPRTASNKLMRRELRARYGEPEGSA